MRRRWTGDGSGEDGLGGGREAEGEFGFDLGEAEEEGGFVAAGAAEPGSDFVVAFAGVAFGAGGDDVEERVAAAAGEGEDAIFVEGIGGGSTVGAAAPGSLEGGPLLLGEVVLHALHADAAAAGGAGFAGAGGGHGYRVMRWCVRWGSR